MIQTDPSTTIVKEIEINAPAAKIFAALTEPDQLARWWGSDDAYRCTKMERELRVGGRWRTTGNGCDGGEFSVGGVYRIVDPPRLLEYTWEPSWGTPHDVETIVRFELEERDGVTRLRLTHRGFSTIASRDEHDKAWTQVLGWLTAFVERSTS
jgi:uncharacterized protein YndB with AHSA1/START domain